MSNNIKNIGNGVENNSKTQGQNMFIVKHAEKEKMRDGSCICVCNEDLDMCEWLYGIKHVDARLFEPSAFGMYVYLDSDSLLVDESREQLPRETARNILREQVIKEDMINWGEY